jgi:hypothetical protein
VCSLLVRRQLALWLVGGCTNRYHLNSAILTSLLTCCPCACMVQVPASWLTAYCSAACDVMPSMSSQQLTMCLWGLGVSGASPHKAFVLLWFLTSMGLMQQATTQVR